MTQPIPLQLRRIRRGPDWRKLGGMLAMFSVLLITQYRKTSAPAREHLAAHGYSILGLGFVSAAAFTHSVFTGLLVTGLLFLLFEWKVSELWAYLCELWISVLMVIRNLA
jgi:hypothetical protein